MWGDKTSGLIMRMTPESRAEIDNYTRATGDTLSAYIRSLLDRDRDRREAAIRATIERATT